MVWSRIAALKQKVEGTREKGRGSYFIKKNCIKLTFWVKMKLKLPLNELFPPQLVSAADKLIYSLVALWGKHSRRDKYRVVYKALTLGTTKQKTHVSIVSFTARTQHSPMLCPHRVNAFFNVNFPVKAALMVLNGACVGGERAELWQQDPFHP